MSIQGNMEKGQFELLAPAGSPEIFRAVLEAGADAVYVGGSRFGARAYADNFTEEELLEALDYAHLRGKKVYLTVNTLMKNREIGRELYDYLLPFYEHGLDAVLVQDFGVLSYIHTVFPDLPIHTSTQMTVTGADGVRFLQSCGVTRVVMAREVSLEEMKLIREETGMELEAFVHGALCYSYSGQCLFSSMLGGRSGNRGRCAQPCRLAYTVLNEKKEQQLPDSYVLSLKDLCGIGDLPALHQAGVYSLKIEGRMKQASYAAGVVSIYRKYIDSYASAEGTGFSVSPEDLRAIADLGNRCGFTDSYYRVHNGRDMVTFQKPNYEKQNEELQAKIRERYVNASSRLSVCGKAVFRRGMPASLSVSGGGKTAEVRGIPVEAAQKAPVTVEEIKNRLQKTGDTPFRFRELIVEAEEGIFFPNGAINQLRREALHRLQELLLADYRRSGRELLPVMEHSYESGLRTDQASTIICSVESRRQLEAILEYRERIADVIYLDTVMYERNSFAEELKEDLEAIKGAGMQAFLMLPAIFRRETSEFYREYTEMIRGLCFRGFVVRNYEELYWARSTFPEKELIADHSLYTYNDYAVRGFRKAGVRRDTVPLELNRNEIFHRENSQSEMLLYGYYPLMTSAQCVHKNSSGCDRKSCITYLKDRYQALFPVCNHCSECYNTVYNSLPTMLFPYQKELEQAGLGFFRLAFTVENSKQVTRILNLFRRYRKGEMQEQIQGRNRIYTNGHYKRGVE